MDLHGSARRAGRRRFAADLARTLLLAPLLDLLVDAQALAGDAHPRAEALRERLARLSTALRAGELDPQGWQRASATLCADIRDSPLLRELRVERLVERLDDDPRRPRSWNLDREPGLPATAGVRDRLFIFGRGEAIVPHGHDNLVSLFIVLRGRFRARHYDRLADTRSHIVIRPTIDREVETGALTSVSEAQDNVHWYTSRSEGALLYNLSVDLSARSRRPQARPGRVYLDPEGVHHPDGTILAPRSDRRSLQEKYDAPAPAQSHAVDVNAGPTDDKPDDERTERGHTVDRTLRSG